MVVIRDRYLVFTIPSNQKEGRGRGSRGSGNGSRGRGSRGRGSRGRGRGRGVESSTIIDEDEKNVVQISSDDDFEATSK
jgi:hypothetical protein